MERLTIPDAHSPSRPSNGPVESGVSPEPNRRVLILDPAPGRRRFVSAIVSGMGGLPRTAGEIDALGTFVSAPPEPIVLIAVGKKNTTDERVLDAIAVCRKSGIQVLAYEDGIDQWPLRVKCLPLLAGASHLLDSAVEGFGNELRLRIDRALQESAGRHREQQQLRELMRRHEMAGDSPAMTGAFRLAARFSVLSDLPVLITGDTGTGKELLARAIAKMDPKRQAGPFVPINCAAVNPALMESEFFGHRRGAFTGAERDRKGLIRAAEGGTLFLDEIGELDPALQAKLLRVLQENSVRRVGDEQEVPVNVRFIAATNRNMEQLVAGQRFRADLYHRLRVLLIHMPPLQDRPADVPALVEHYLKKHAAIHSSDAVNASNDFIEALQQMDLPGNVRQLQNIVRRSLANHQGAGALELNDLPEEALLQLTARPGETRGPSLDLLRNTPALHLPHAPPAPHALPGPLPPADIDELVTRILDGQGWNLSNALREYERRVLGAAMDRTRGNQSQAARLLGITARSVYNKVRKHQLHPGNPDSPA